MTTAPYILGHDHDELARLIDQARFIGDLTDEVLRRAGVGPGMRVLDVGCGASDVPRPGRRHLGAGLPAVRHRRRADHPDVRPGRARPPDRPEVEVDTLADRLREELVAADATVVPPPLVGAWARKPAP